MAKPRFLTQKGWNQHEDFALPKMRNHEPASALSKCSKANKSLNDFKTAMGRYTLPMHHPVGLAFL